MDNVKKKILVVDDVDTVLRMLAAVISSFGFEVKTATNGLEGLRSFASDIDCVVTDRDMPLMEGTELAEKIKAINPRVPVILISGDPEPAGHKADRFMGKPIRLGDLKQVFIDLLVLKPAPL